MITEDFLQTSDGCVHQVVNGTGPCTTMYKKKMMIRPVTKKELKYFASDLQHKCNVFFYHWLLNIFYIQQFSTWIHFGKG